MGFAEDAFAMFAAADAEFFGADATATYTAPGEDSPAIPCAVLLDEGGRMVGDYAQRWAPGIRISLLRSEIPQPVKHARVVHNGRAYLLDTPAEESTRELAVWDVIEAAA